MKLFTNSTFKQWCLIIAVPFYAHAQETPKDATKQPDLVWHFTITRTTSDMTQPWLQVLADYVTAGCLFLGESDNTTLTSMVHDIETCAQQHNYVLSSLDKNASSSSLLGRRIIELVHVLSNDEGIHGELGVKWGIDDSELLSTGSIEWELSLSLTEESSAEAFTKIKNIFTQLTEELTTLSLADNDPNFGRLLHGVALAARTSNAYSCTATLTVKS